MKRLCCHILYATFTHLLKAFVILAVFNVTYTPHSTHLLSFLTFSMAGTLLESYHCTESFLGWNLNSRELALYSQFLFILASSCLCPDTCFSTSLWFFHSLPSAPFQSSLDPTAHHQGHCSARVIMHPTPVSWSPGPAQLQRWVNTTVGLSGPHPGVGSVREIALLKMIVSKFLIPFFPVSHSISDLPSLFSNILPNSSYLPTWPLIVLQRPRISQGEAGSLTWDPSRLLTPLSGLLVCCIASLPLFFPTPLYLANSCLFIVRPEC